MPRHDGRSSAVSEPRGHEPRWLPLPLLLLLLLLCDRCALTEPMAAVRQRQLQEAAEPVECVGEWSACTTACEMVPGNRFGYAARACTEQAGAVAKLAVDCADATGDARGDCECPPGNFYGLNCDPCLPGKYDHDLDTSTPCVDCIYGKYSPGGSVLSCTLCEPGRYAASNGTAECQECPPGEQAGRGARRCAPTYSDSGSGAEFRPASHMFLCADDENARGVKIATKFQRNEQQGILEVVMPLGYRVGCDGDENETSAAYADCENDILCEFPALADDSRIPETGLDCTWSGARCVEGFVGEMTFGCGTVAPAWNSTAADLMTRYAAGQSLPDLTPLGCSEKEPEPEPEAEDADVRYCDPRPAVPSVAPCGFDPNFDPEDPDSNIACPDCCMLVDSGGAWALDTSQGKQPECYDAIEDDDYASTTEKSYRFINRAGGGSRFACQCPPIPEKLEPPGVPVYGFVILFCCCACFGMIVRKLRGIQTRHTERRAIARYVMINIFYLIVSSSGNV